MSSDLVRLDEVMGRLAAARVWAVRQLPQLATAVLAVVTDVRAPWLTPAGGPTPDPRLAAGPTDPRWVAHVDPVTVLRTPVEETGWWLLHQVGHLVRDHAARAPIHPAPPPDPAGTEVTARSPAARRWQQAADAEINEELAAHGLRAPHGQPTPGVLGLPPGRPAEEYLARLTDRQGWRTPAPRVDCGSGCDGVARVWDDTGHGFGPAERAALRRSLHPRAW